MSTKYLKIPDGDYKIQVQSGGIITLDTGIDTGEVVITGNLKVEGTTTSINTTDLDIFDRVILLNKGESGTGITALTDLEKFAGIEIDRGNAARVSLVFQEAIGTQTSGSFEFRVGGTSGSLVPLTTNEIRSRGQNLTLLDQNNGIVKVGGYDSDGLEYRDRILQLDDGNSIPNKSYVDSAVLGNVGIRKIFSGTLTESAVEVFDFESTGQDSRVEVRINGIITTTFLENSVEVQGVRMVDNTISAASTSDNLILTHGSNSSILVNNTLEVRSLPNPLITPAPPTNGVKIYTGPQSIGGTGIYFVNQDQTRDELTSRSKSILYGIIF